MTAKTNAFRVGNKYRIFSDGQSGYITGTCTGRTKRTVRITVTVAQALRFRMLTNDQLRVTEFDPGFDPDKPSTWVFTLVDKPSEDTERGTCIEISKYSKKRRFTTVA